MENEVGNEGAIMLRQHRKEGCDPGSVQGEGSKLGQLLPHWGTAQEPLKEH
jgi:hypothetical protein